ncbi:MAG TPA: hypothetical protein VLH61_09575 [Bacteroidales bacterium]|nr:hypothetical protein [Bacteroidales bacterium]
MKVPSAVITLVFLMFLLPAKPAMSQEEAPEPKGAYLTFETGVSFGPIMVIDCYLDVHNIGVRIFSEYKRGIRDRWYYGISFDGMIPISDQFLPLSNNVSVTAYHRLTFVQEKLFLWKGLGLGSNFIFVEDDPLRVGPTLSLNLSMSWRFAPNAYFEFSPFLLLPTRLHIPLSFIAPHNAAMTIPFPSVGLKFLL